MLFDYEKIQPLKWGIAQPIIFSHFWSGLILRLWKMAFGKPIGKNLSVSISMSISM